MKLFKKLAAALVATMLIMTVVGSTAFAATVTVTSGTEPTDLTAHTFKAYQIFTGTQGSGSKLTNLAWGDGIDNAAFTAELIATLGDDKGFKSGTTTPEAVAKVFSGYYTSDDDKVMEQVAQIAYKHIIKIKGRDIVAGENAKVTAGYYLIVDETNTIQGTDDVANAALLQVTDTIKITVKTDKPSVEKKVIENVKYDQSGTGDLNKDSGNYLVKHENDTADYSIGDKVPFKLHSVVPDMSHYVGAYKYIFHDTMADSLDYVADSVVVSVNGVAVNDTTKYDVDDDTPHKLTITIPNLKDIARKGDLITVDFKATLNEHAYIGKLGTGNTNEVYLEYSNQPNGNGSGTGQTPGDKVIVFTYELDVNKVDENNQPLDDAKFKFYKESGSTKYYVTVNSGTSRVEGWSTNSGTATEFTSTSGTFGIIGLDDGTYFLVETAAPANYNKLLSAVRVDITANTSNRQDGSGSVNDLTSLFVKANGKSGTFNVTSGTVGISIENTSGTVLPSTGGIGTTIFYVLGAILVLGGGVLLVTRRRMAA